MIFNRGASDSKEQESNPIAKDRRIYDDPSELARLKWCHFQLNLDSLDREMKKRDDKMEKTFLGQRIVEGVGPWSHQPQIDD